MATSNTTQAMLSALGASTDGAGAAGEGQELATVTLEQ